MKGPSHLRRWDQIPSRESNPGHIDALPIDQLSTDERIRRARVIFPPIPLRVIQCHKKLLLHQELLMPFPWSVASLSCKLQREWIRQCELHRWDDRQGKNSAHFHKLRPNLKSWLGPCLYGVGPTSALLTWSRRTTCAKYHGLFYLSYPQISEVTKCPIMLWCCRFRISKT